MELKFFESKKQRNIIDNMRLAHGKTFTKHFEDHKEIVDTVGEPYLYQIGKPGVPVARGREPSRTPVVGRPESVSASRSCSSLPPCPTKELSEQITLIFSCTILFDHEAIWMETLTFRIIILL